MRMTLTALPMTSAGGARLWGLVASELARFKGFEPLIGIFHGDYIVDEPRGHDNVSSTLIRSEVLTMDKTAQERFEHSVSQPFSPAHSTGAGLDMDLQLRLATAAEYAAAQLGFIARALVQIESHLAHSGRVPQVPPPEMPPTWTAASQAVRDSQHRK
jgi:hypothetical protein